MGALTAEPGAGGIPQALADVGHQPLGILGSKNNLNFTKAGAFPFGRGASLGSGRRSFAWALPILRRILIDEGHGSSLQLSSPKRWD